MGRETHALALQLALFAARCHVLGGLLNSKRGKTRALQLQLGQGCDVGENHDCVSRGEWAKVPGMN